MSSAVLGEVWSQSQGGEKAPEEETLLTYKGREVEERQAQSVSRGKDGCIGKAQQLLAAGHPWDHSHPMSSAVAASSVPVAVTASKKESPGGWGLGEDPTGMIFLEVRSGLLGKSVQAAGSGGPKQA